MPDESADAFNAAIEALLVLYASDVVCYPAPGWVEATVCHGHDGFRQLSAAWSENVDHPALEVHEVRDMQDRLLVLAEFTGRAKESGGPIRQRFGVINSDLRDDGKVGEARFFLDWEQARAAAGLAG
jgi:ketosteroid isomerase-like protein